MKQDAMGPVTVTATVESVSRDDRHRFSKATVPGIRLIAGFGVEGDAHAGTTTQHRYLVRTDPTRPNLTQVHFLAAELFDELQGAGFEVSAGELGENVTTRGLDLFSLPRGARLRLGADAVVEITGMRNPCSKINGLQKGLMKRLITTDASGQVIRKAGIMGVVIVGGTVSPGDGIVVDVPSGEQVALGVV
ncbi:MOSC domain-containing protein [Cryobacterium cryoconiti]|uniref:MOSC domain-containing protein n=1 Tax=Cryobacterium cryoconiti TaxID=1259239 RepID=UPI001F542ECA|nr:MOSC domain-containing protein [Cryobacterium cryoconiti]